MSDETGSPGQAGGGRARRVVVATLQGIALLVVALGVVTIRVVVAGEQELTASTEALFRGDPREAVVRARRSAGWYAPGAPHVPVAYDRLRALAEEAERQGDDDIALLAWRGVRSASLESRWIVVPHAADLTQADREIARLMRGAGADPVTEPRSVELSEQLLQGLGQRSGPRLPWVITLVLAFVAAACGLGLWARQVAGPGGRPRWSHAKSGALLAIVGMALWLLAVWRA